MLGTIQFHSKLRAMSVEIDNTVSNAVLSAESHRIFLQKTIPEQLFFLCLVFPKILRIALQCGVSFQGITLQKFSRFLMIEHSRPHSSSDPLTRATFPPGEGFFMFASLR